MIAFAKVETQEHATLEVYLGFMVTCRGENSYVAIPTGWGPVTPVILEGASLPLIRTRIWGWWHRLLD